MTAPTRAWLDAVRDEPDSPALERAARYWYGLELGRCGGGERPAAEFGRAFRTRPASSRPPIGAESVSGREVDANPILASRVYDIKVHGYASVYDKVGSPTTLRDALHRAVTSQREFDRRRDLAPGDRKRWKLTLPCVRVAGVFDGSDLVEASGYAQFDLDAKDNPGKSADEMLEVCRGLFWVALATKSMSGRGVWGLLPVPAGRDYKRAAGLAVDALANAGLKADVAQTAPQANRTPGWHGEPYVNPAAIPLPSPRAPIRRPRREAESRDDVHDDIAALVRVCVARSVSLFDDFDSWFQGSLSLASLGEAGRGYFHDLSAVWPDYDARACDKRFDKALRRSTGKTTVATVFHLAKQAGIDLKALRE